MEKGILFCVLNFAIFIEVSLGQLDPCAVHCQGTYPLHTFEKSEASGACMQGCRFSKITQFTVAHRETEDVSQYCKKDCAAAYYSNADLTFACSVGCEHQEVLPTPDALFKAQSGVDGYLTLFPVVVFRRYCLGMLDQAASLWHVRTSVLIDGTTGGGVVMKIEVSDSSNMGPISYVAIKDEGSDDDDGRARGSLADRVVLQSRHWLSCVVSKAGLPRWALFSVLLLVALCLLSICFHPDEDSAQEKVHTFDKQFGVSPEYDYTKVPLFAVATVDKAGPLLDKVPPRFVNA